MLTITPQQVFQMEMDLETDETRLGRLDWQRAIDANLHAIQDYVAPDQLIIWQPGSGGRNGLTAFDVQLASSTSCTCQRWRLRNRCEHVAFVKRLEGSGTRPNTDQPILATEIKKEVTA